MIQEIIPGDAKYVYGFNAYYDKSSSPKGVFMYRRIREWPHGFGNGCFIESVIIPEMEEIINPFIKKINYYGIVDAEFKKNPLNNKLKLIEINSRSWMQNSLSARCGVNLSHIAYMDAIGKDVKKVVNKRKHVKWLFMLEDAYSSLKNISQDMLTLQEWVRSYKGKKEYAIFACDDPLPFFALYAKVIYSIFPYLLKRIIYLIYKRKTR